MIGIDSRYAAALFAALAFARFAASRFFASALSARSFGFVVSDFRAAHLPLCGGDACSPGCADSLFLSYRLCARLL